MALRKAKWTSLAFVAALALSVASFGFLVGRSHSSATNNTTEQLHAVGEQVKVGGAVVLRGANAVRRLLVR